MRRCSTSPTTRRRFSREDAFSSRRHRTLEAAATLEKAARLNPLPEYQWALADALRSRQTRSTKPLRSRSSSSSRARTIRARSPSTCRHGVRTATGQSISRGASWRTRSDIFTLDALAWALASAGKIDEASALMNRALAEGTEDARLFLHAAVIAAADGRPADAARWQRKARKLRFMLLPSELGVLRTGIVTHTPGMRSWQ